MTHGKGPRSHDRASRGTRTPPNRERASERKRTMKERMVVEKEDRMKHLISSDAGICIGPFDILRDCVKEDWMKKGRVGRCTYQGMEYGVLPKGDGTMLAVIPAESGSLEREHDEDTRIIAWSGVRMGIVLIPGNRGSRIEFTSGTRL